jgi:hypothetical protein
MVQGVCTAAATIASVDSGRLCTFKWILVVHGFFGTEFPRSSPRMAASYSNLLSLLRNGGPKFRSLSPETLLNAISYFLTHNHPKQVTSFTHLIAISPPLWSTLERLGDVGGAFRASVHMKVKEISKEGGEGWFARRTERAALGEWVSSILEGLVQATSASEGVVRLAIVGGVLQGLNDIKEEIEVDGVRGKVEDQVLVCVAELMDSMLGDDAQIKWENEFKVDSRDGKVPSESMSLPFLNRDAFLKGRSYRPTNNNTLPPPRSAHSNPRLKASNPKPPRPSHLPSLSTRLLIPNGIPNRT